MLFFLPFRRVFSPYSRLLTAALSTSACISSLDDLTPSLVESGESGDSRATSTAPSTNTATEEGTHTTPGLTGASSGFMPDAGVSITPPVNDADTESTPDPLSSDNAATTTAITTTSTLETTTVLDAAVTTEPASVGSSPITFDAAIEDASVPPTNTIPSVFTPESGLLVWFDAAHEASFDSATGATQTWRDRSGNQFDLTQAAMGSRPQRTLSALNSRAVVRFDGVDDSMSTLEALDNQAFEVFLVWRSAVAPTSVKSSILVNDRNFEVNYSHTAPEAANATSVCVGANCVNNSGWYNARFSPNPQADVAYLWNPAFSELGSDLVTRVWGGSVTTQSAPDGLPVAATTPLLIANCVEGSCPFNGDIAEIAMFERALTLAERTEVETYLTSKWDLSVP